MADRAVPATREPWTRRFTRIVGGPGGAYLSRAYSWFNPATTSVALATIMWVLAVLRQVPCMQRPGQSAPNAFEKQCYTDITVLYTGRGLADGNTPYLDTGSYPPMEYPVGTGWLMELCRLIASWLGAPVGPGLNGEQTVIATNMFYAVNMVVLFVLLLVLVITQVRTVPGRGWDTLMVAASPSILLVGLINWDLFPVALTALGVLLWKRRSPAAAGVLFGLSMATKLYAGFLLGPLLLLCLRTGKWREFLRTLGGFVVSWLAVNLPVLILAPEQWLRFWTFNSERGGDFGSIWYVFALAGHPFVDLNVVSTIWFLIGCAGIGGLCLLAPTRPRVGQVFFLVLVAFLLTNKVYSPQYSLWLVPMLALCRPRWRDWVIFSAGEALYVGAIWGHLGGYLRSGDSDPIYWAATIVRMGTQLWVAATVVRNIVRPSTDIVRAERAGDTDQEVHWVDDPSGGVLDGAPDTPWWRRLRERINAALAGVRPLVPARSVPGTPLPGITPRVDRWDRAGARWLLGVGLGSRLLLLLTAVLVMRETGHTFTQVLMNWDAQHYVGLARDGYQLTGDPDVEKRMAFFPGLPLLIHALGLIGIPGAYAGLLISLVASAGAAAALYRMGGFWAGALWLLAPAGVFTMMPYTESLFCAFAFWAWERARSDKWLAAGLLAGGACAVRVSGLFLIGALGIMVLTHKMPEGTSLAERLVGWLRRAGWLLIPAAVMFSYAWYLHRLTGSWTQWYTAQAAGWSRAWTAPWTSVKTTLDVILGTQYDKNPGWDLVFSFEIVSMAVGLLAVGFLLRRRLWAEAAWIGVQALAFSTSQWLFSVNRAVLLWFPVWIIAAELIARRPRTRTGLIWHRALHICWLIGSTLIMMWWARMYYTGQWSS